MLFRSPGKNTAVGLPCPPPGDLPDPGIEPQSPAVQANSLQSEPPGKPNVPFRIVSGNGTSLQYSCLENSIGRRSLVACGPWGRKESDTTEQLHLYLHQGFPGASDSKESACNAGDLGSIPGLGRSPGARHGNPLQYSCLENPHGQRSLTGYRP